MRQPRKEREGFSQARVVVQAAERSPLALRVALPDEAWLPVLDEAAFEAAFTVVVPCLLAPDVLAAADCTSAGV